MNFNTPQNNLIRVPLPTSLLLLFLLVSFCALLGTTLAFGFASLNDFDFQAFTAGLVDISGIRERNIVRVIVMLNQLFMFLVPALVFSYMYKRNNWQGALTLNQKPAGQDLLLGMLLILAAFPLAQYSFSVFHNAEWLPEWARSMEDNTETMIKSLLQTDHLYELFFNLLIIAVIPATGEEFIFRGILQNELQKRLPNGHYAVWIAAILFSAVHFQFEGFVARVILGAVLGYLFYYTRNIWVPVFAHFINNGVQVAVSYFYKDEMLNAELDQSEEFPLSVVIVSLFVVFALGNFLKNKNLADHQNTI